MFQPPPLHGLALLLVLGCGGPAATGAVSAQTTAPPPAPAKPWAGLDLDERKRFMADQVVPRMQDLFSKHDPQRFDNFGCATCHGAQRRARNFAMPNPDLLTLYPTGSAQQNRTVQEHEAIATFMFQLVTPTMRELLDIPRFDPATGEGFSCFYCHPQGRPDDGLER